MREYACARVEALQPSRSSVLKYFVIVVVVVVVVVIVVVVSYTTMSQTL